MERFQDLKPNFENQNRRGNSESRNLTSQVKKLLNYFSLKKKIFETKIKMISSIESNLQNYLIAMGENIQHDSVHHGPVFKKMSQFDSIRDHFDRLNLFLSERVYFDMLCRRLQVALGLKGNFRLNFNIADKRSSKDWAHMVWVRSQIENNESFSKIESDSNKKELLSSPAEFHEIMTQMKMSVGKILNNWANHCRLSIRSENLLFQKILNTQNQITGFSRSPQFGNRNHLQVRHHFQERNREGSKAFENILSKRSHSYFKSLKKICSSSETLFIRTKDNQEQTFNRPHFKNKLKIRHYSLSEKKNEEEKKMLFFKKKSDFNQPRITKNQETQTTQTENSELKDQTILCSKCKSQISNPSELQSQIAISNQNHINNDQRIFKLESQSQIDQYKTKFDDFLKQDAEDVFDFEKEASLSLFKCSLEGMLVRIMFNLPINRVHLESLDEPQKALFRVFLLKKKFINKDTPKLIDLPKSAFKQTYFAKRVEENLKLVFKKAFRHFRGIFAKTNGHELGKLLKSEFRIYSNWKDYCLYGLYFEETSVRMDMPIERFFEPGTIMKKYRRVSKKKKLVPKSLSKVYIHSIKKSKKFMEHLDLFSKTILFRECGRIIRKKARTLAMEWNSLLAESGLEQALKVLDTNFLQNERCKLAWSIEDVRMALKSAQKYLDEQ